MTSHTMLRTAASLLDDAGLPLREVSGQLNHTDLRTTYLYLDRRQATTRAAEVL
jgi:integrase